MEKFSFFDLLSFAIPGGTSMVLIYWATTNITDLRIGAFSLPETLLVVALLMIAYFMGHVINELGMKLESSFGHLPKSWVEILESNPDLAQNINTIAQKVFDKSFINADGSIDPQQSGIVYDYAFNLLEVNEKLEKVRILQSQYVFFRNGIVLALLAVAAFLSVAVSQFLAACNFWDATVIFSVWGVIASAIAARFARYLSIKRRKMKMSATLHNFYAYYVSETKLKSK